jgi:hypothetical protein
MNIGLVKTFTAGGAIAANTLVKFSADDTVVQASAATDNIIGVCVQPNGAGSGDRVDVQLTGIAKVKMGGTVARGAPVTADSNAKGVAPAPAAGVNNRIAGFAMRTAADGDLADVLLVPGFDQGAGLS